MSEDVKNYALSEVTCNFMGVPIESGFGDGDAIRIEPASPSFTSKVGADGSIVRCATGNKLYRVLINLLKTSDGNQVLSAIHNFDIRTSNGSGIGPLLVRDRLGTSIFQAGKAWIVTSPAQAYGAEVGNNEWELAAQCDVNNVGNN